MVLAGAFFSWSTVFLCGLEQPLVQAVHGCCLSVLEACGRISCSSWPPRRVIRTWNLVHYFHVPVSGSHYSGRLGVAEEFGKLDFWEMPFSWVQYLVRQWIHVLRGLWKNLHYFLRCGELES